MALPVLKDFYLVGGTALSLKFGHRESIDLDLFCSENFNKPEILKGLRERFGEAFSYESIKPSWALFCYINDVKVDLVKYPHQRIAQTQTIDGIRFYNDLDIAGMKINTILGRGKKKDFYDLRELFDKYTLTKCIQAYEQKYPNQQLLISIPTALTYFTDANESEEPVTQKGQTWEQVKDDIRAHVRDYLK